MRILSLILFLLLSGSVIRADEQLLKLLKEYYSHSFEVASDDVSIEILRIQDIQEPWQDHEMKIASNNASAKCGTQHAWLTFLDDGRVMHKMPITLNLSVFKNVWVANYDLKRNQPLLSGMLRRNKQEINRNYSKFIFDDLDFSGRTQIARKLEKGMVLTKQMLSVKPDVKRGDRLNVSLVSENFSINMAGKAKQNGSIGEEIFVSLNKTGKRLKGIIESPKQVIVRN